MTAALVAGGVILLALLLYWLLVTTEGIYLGRRVVVWLYDVSAGRYDAMKAFDPDWEQAFLARPLLRALAERPAPLVLDVASGTGRVPALLLAEPHFNGRVIALEPARRMLQRARPKMTPYRGRAGLVQATAAPLPFGDSRFDAVTCVEALEFFPSAMTAIEEMIRVLRPGGVLLLTRRAGRDARAFLGRYRTREGVRDELSRLPLVDISVEAWQIDYDLVWARKAAR